MGNGYSEEKIRPAFPMYEMNYNTIIPPSGKKTDKQQLQYIKDHNFIKPYEKPYPKIGDYEIKYYIPRGTKLYHSSFTYYQKFDEDRITFFGIDIIIALWYLFEQSEKEALGFYDENYGYIYEFDVIKDIPVHIYNEINPNPKNNPICMEKEIACIHPQYAYRGNSATTNKKEMSTELTMNLQHYKIGEYIERTTHPKTQSEIIYLINMPRLRKIAKENKNFSEYNPIPYNPSQYKKNRDPSESRNKNSAITGMVIPPKNNSNKKGDPSVLRKSRKAKHANAAAARSTSKSRSRSRSKSKSRSRSRSKSRK